MRANSGVTARAAPWERAARTPRAISAEFPFRSPAVGLIWRSAIRKAEFQCNNNALLIDLRGRQEIWTYLDRHLYIIVMKEDTVRTSLNVPVGLHRRLHEAAAQKGCSARQLILRVMERPVREMELQRPQRRLSMDVPIVASTGKPFDLTNEQIYDQVP